MSVSCPPASVDDAWAAARLCAFTVPSACVPGGKMSAPVPVQQFLQAGLEDKYEQREGRVFMSGTQALVRLAIQQRQRDVNAGKNTAGFISGYRGSPLG